jgi:hypothetical protein
MAATSINETDVIDALEQRLDALEARLDRLDAKFPPEPKPRPAMVFPKPLPPPPPTAAERQKFAEMKRSKEHELRARGLGHLIRGGR